MYYSRSFLFSHDKNSANLSCSVPHAWSITTIYYMAELVRADKELSDWFPKRSEFSYTDHQDGPLTKRWH